MFFLAIVGTLKIRPTTFIMMHPFKKQTSVMIMNPQMVHYNYVRGNENIDKKKGNIMELHVTGNVLYFSIQITYLIAIIIIVIILSLLKRK
jgi:hypothetical protein